MTQTSDGSTVRQREYALRVLMGEPPLRAARSLPSRERETNRRRRRLSREFLRKYCVGCVGGWWRG